jgi:hypothetical protein
VIAPLRSKQNISVYLSLIKQKAMKIYGRGGGKLLVYYDLFSELDAGKWSASRPYRFTKVERLHVTTE